MSEFSLGVGVSLIYLSVLVWALLGERIRDSFKCAQMTDGLRRGKTGDTILWKSKNRNHGVARPSRERKLKVILDPRTSVPRAALPSGAPLTMPPTAL